MNRALWFVGPGRVEIRDAGVLRDLGPGDVRARAIVSGVSQGTELLLYNGEGPTPFDASLVESAHGNRQGEAPAPTYPRRYGYAWVGEVTDVGADVAAPIAPGTRVFSLASHGDAHVLDVANVRAIPDGVPSARAVLAANLETAVTATWDAGVGLGDRVVVVGGGIVGLLCGWLARRAGAGHVHVIEPSARRRAAAMVLGATSVAAPGDTRDEPSHDADVVFEASGRPELLDRAIALAGVEATVVVVSFYGARTSAVQLGDAFHRRRLRLVATQVSSIPPARAPRWSYARRFELVAALLHEPALDGLLDPPAAFDDAAAAYARLVAAPGDSLQVCFRYRDAV